MNEAGFAAPDIAASQQRGIPTDEGELWETLRRDAKRPAVGEASAHGPWAALPEVAIEQVGDKTRVAA